MTLINSQLDLPSRLRLRRRFARFNRNPTLFSAEIKAAERVFDLVTKSGYKLEIDRGGYPRAIAPAPLTLTPSEVNRFAARVAVMGDSEIAETTKQMTACFVNGLIPRVSGTGRLTAHPRPKVERLETDWKKKAEDHKKFWSRHSNASAFVKLPSKIV